MTTSSVQPPRRQPSALELANQWAQLPPELLLRSRHLNRSFAASISSARKSYVRLH